MNTLRMLRSDQGKLDEAEPLARENLEARRQVLGGRHRDTPVSINNLSTLLRDQGKLDEAEPLARENSETCRRGVEVAHPKAHKADKKPAVQTGTTKWVGGVKQKKNANRQLSTIHLRFSSIGRTATLGQRGVGMVRVHGFAERIMPRSARTFPSLRFGCI